MSVKNHRNIKAIEINTFESTYPALKSFSRDDLLRANREIIEQLQDRIKGKRFRPQEGDLIKIQYMKTLIYALKCANEILKDAQLEDIDERLAMIEDIYNERSAEESMPNRSLVDEHVYT